MTKKGRRLRSRKEAPQKVWRPRRKKEVLPTLYSLVGPLSLATDEPLERGFPVTAGGIVPGPRRCLAIELERGDCQMFRVENSVYCYYHDKLLRGVCEPDAPIYPVWPLPAKGYVIEDAEEVAA